MTTSKNIQPIGRHVYGKLSAIRDAAPDSLTKDQLQQIAQYEAENIKGFTPEQEAQRVAYIQKVKSHQEGKSFKTLDPDKLKAYFLKRFQEMNGISFQITEDSHINLHTLVMYFCKNERFFKSPALVHLNEPSFKKGLMVIGDFGCGKSSMFKVFENIFSQNNYLPAVFKRYDANRVVTLYEGCEKRTQIDEFWETMISGVKHFDDVKAERLAKNYGKEDLFREIIEMREDKNLKTHITCNYSETKPGNVDAALEEFGNRYGSRVYDRLFKMFNFIHFKGQSFRK